MKLSTYQTDARCPLDNVRILDLTRFVAGNQFSVVLGDLGAEVIKVEHPQTGDPLRTVYEKGVFWKVYARNKKSVTLNLKHPVAKQILLQLVDNAHVLAENFVPGTMERFGLGPDELLDRNPKLVFVRISGWGQTGPYAHRPGFGTVAEATSGFTWLNGFEDRPPALAPLALADMVAGTYAAVAALAALHHTLVDGGAGQVVDVSLFEPLLSFMGPDAALYKQGIVKTRGIGEFVSTVRGAYETKDGYWISMSAATSHTAERFFKAIGREEVLQDPRFDSPAARLKNRKELDGIIGEFYGRYTLEECNTFIMENQITAGPVYDITQILNDPHIQERQVIVELPDPENESGSVPMHNVVPRLSATPGAIRLPAPKLGEHNDEIFGEIGYSREQLERLKAVGVV